MRTFDLKKVDIQPQKEIYRRFPIIGGEACPRVFCITVLVWLAMTMFAPDTQKDRSSFPSSTNEESFGVRSVGVARQMSVAWNRFEKSCPDDFYLKLSHLKKTFHKDLEKFDLILVDEGQDLSQVMLDALAHCSKRIVLVGDTHQGIYGFRHAVDAMRLLNGDQTFDLSLSFRFGEPVAALAERFIAEAKGESHFKIRGNENRKSRVFFYSDLSSLDLVNGTAILSRTNLGLFRKAMFLRTKRWPFRFERDIKSDLLKTLDVYRLYCGETELIRDPWIKSFETIERLDQYAEKSQDFQLSNISQIVKLYAAEFPGAIFEMIKLTETSGNGADRGAVVLSTVHTAKGQQYERVIIDEDVVEAVSRTAERNPKQFKDEVNVAYVCLTRVKEQHWLPESIKRILTPAWQGYMDSLIPKLGVQASVGKIEGEKIRVKPKTGHLPKQRVVPSQLAYSAGDRQEHHPRRVSFPSEKLHQTA